MNNTNIVCAPKQECVYPKLIVHMIGTKKGFDSAPEVLRGLGINPLTMPHAPGRELVQCTLKIIEHRVSHGGAVGEYPDQHIVTCDEAVILAVRLAVKRKIVQPRNVTIRWYPESMGRCDGSIQVDQNGSLSDYPDGFMDTMNDVLLELMR